MFKPGNQVVIEVPGQSDAWVFGKVLRVEGDRLVASDGRSYPAEGGENLGNVHPHHILHPADHETSGKVVSTLLRQRVLGLVAEASARGQHIAAWHITERIGLVVASGMLDSVMIEEAIRRLIADGLRRYAAAASATSSPGPRSRSGCADCAPASPPFSAAR